MKLELQGITKRFGSFTANDGIDLVVEPGTIHALLGENGAGKSTLMNVLFGLLAADEGRVLVDGEPVQFSGPRDAMAAGIGMVHQHFMLVPVFTVAENVVLGDEPVRGGGVLDRAQGRRAGARDRRPLRLPPRPRRRGRRPAGRASSSGWRSSRRSSATPRCSSSTSRPRCSRRRRPTSS